MNGLLDFKPRPDNSTLHTDQSPKKNFLWSYQGIMTLTDAGNKGGGFVCVPKSHLYHQ
jgi:expansin (peptidoglycan-binding protein)